jgi:PAS domain S-box-containing protein
VRNRFLRVNKMNRCQQSDHHDLYQKLVETTATGYVVLDKSGHVLDANKEYVLLTGHRRLDEIRGRSVIEWTAAYDKKKNTEAVKECFNKGKIRGLEIDYVDKKGKTTTLEINATAVKDQGKRSILTLCRDVSERKKMQEELRQSEALLKAQLNNSPDAIMVLDRDYKFISINHNVFTKFNLKELIGEYAIKFLPTDVRKLVKSKVDRCFATGQLQEFEHHVGNGLWALARIAALKSSKTIDRVMIISTNVTERKKAEEALRLSQEQLLANLENTPNVAVQWYDEDGRILYWNPASEKLYGWKSTEALGKTLGDLMPTPKEEAAFLSILYGVRDAGKPYGLYETRIRRRDGTLGWVLATTFSTPMGPDRMVFVCMDVDITERKRAEEELTQKNIALGEMIKQIDYEKEKIKKEITVNVEELLIPTLKKLSLNGGSSKYVQLLEHNLEELTASFGSKITDKKNRLTPKEIEICNMVKSGLSSKDIAGLLNVSSLTVSKHRRNIRKKLSISNIDVNLVSFLKTL